MSVDVTHYFGVGIALDPDGDYWDFTEEHPEYDQYFFRDGETRVRLIVDGMCGDYVYLMYVLNRADDLYSSSATKEFALNSLESSDIIKELQTAYFILTDGKELPIKDVKIVSLFHAS